MFKYVFFGIFAAVGIGIFAFFSIPTITDWSEIKSWHSADAYIQSTELKTSRSDDTTTYQATAKYTYDYLGTSYQGDRIGLSSGSDNIGSYQQDWHTVLKGHEQQNTSITVWVNPDNPSEAIIDRDLRWGLLLFQTLFLLIFGGVGIGGIIVCLHADKNAKPLVNNDPNKPWLSYRDWHKPTILSNAKLANRFLLGFAIFWNLISLGGVFAAISAIQQGEFLAMLVMIFPAVGAILIYWWYKANKEYQAIGKMPLTLSPYPASIGGQFGGTIKLATRLNALPDDTEISLQCFETFRSGKETRERILWEDAKPAYWQNDGSGQSIIFYFDLADDLPVPDIPSTPNGKEWRLRLTATLPDGSELDREYSQLPVFSTQQMSPLSRRVQALEQSPDAKQQHRKLLDSILPVKPCANGHQLHFPAYQRTGALIMTLVGLIFVVVGVALPSLIFNIIFPLIGGFVAIGSLTWFASSLTVDFGHEGITANRSVFGIARKPQFIPSYEFKKFAKKKAQSSSRGNKVTQYYSIEAHDNNGKKISVARDLKGTRNAQAAIEKLTELTQY